MCEGLRLQRAQLAIMEPCDQGHAQHQQRAVEREKHLAAGGLRGFERKGAHGWAGSARVPTWKPAMTHRVTMSVTAKHVAYPTLGATNSGIRSMVTMF